MISVNKIRRSFKMTCFINLLVNAGNITRLFQLCIYISRDPIKSKFQPTSKSSFAYLRRRETSEHSLTITRIKI